MSVMSSTSIKSGVLLVNLGTPNSPRPQSVRQYLNQFLTDGRVIDLSWLWRQLLVRCLIVPKRYRTSAKNYSRIWTEEGSPLKVYGDRVKNSLQEALGARYQVELAMRYQSPSIESGLELLKGSKKLTILPLFPQYASATTGSVHEEVMRVLKSWRIIPELRFINSYPTNQKMIEAFAAQSRSFNLKAYDHIIFSFHGLPEKHLRDVDPHHCYSAQCNATAKAISFELGVSQDQFTVCYQSRLGNDPWLKPYTSETLKILLKEEKRKILVFCPSFVCDCLETIDEIGNEYRREFIHCGGDTLDLVPGLNDHPLWIEALSSLLI